MGHSWTGANTQTPGTKAQNTVVPEIVLSQAPVPEPSREGGAGNRLFSVILKPNCNVKLLCKLSVRGTETVEL